jgi:phthiocerol/phenolphthiocerol synthesis type-I polyketide synthase E
VCGRRSTTAPIGPGTAAFRARCRLRTVAAEQATSHSGLLTFGPHWSSLREVHVGVDEELGWFELPERYRAELGSWVLHPALLDEATSFGTSRGGSYLPMGYGRLLVRAPLPPRLWSHLRYRDSGDEVLVADLTLMDETGAEVAAISEFVLRRVDPATVRAGLDARQTGEPAAADQSRVAARSEEIGISPLDGADALLRMLEVDLGPQVTVTATDVRRVISSARAVTKNAVAEGLDQGEAVGERSERTLGDVGIAPRTDLERTLCALWESVLGVGPIGVDADFFDLGGNSLVAVQLIAQVRKAVGRKLPMRTLFEAPTVAGMAAAIERLAAEDSTVEDDVPAITPLASRKEREVDKMRPAVPAAGSPEATDRP